MEDEIWLTVKEAAVLTGVSIQTVYSWVRRGHLKVRRSRPPGPEALPSSERREGRDGHPRTRSEAELPDRVVTPSVHDHVVGISAE
jgi:hypothetical protein